MNDLLLVLGVFGFTIIACMIWTFCQTVFTRWLHNDWCRHSWGKWEDRPGGFRQQRECTKCGYKEIREP